MICTQSLKDRLKELQLSLKSSEKKFNDFKDKLKLAKQELSDCRGAILEIEKLLLVENN
jgi:primosomal protein N''